jgi:hypothetical protein
MSSYKLQVPDGCGALNLTVTCAPRKLECLISKGNAVLILSYDYILAAADL